MVKRQMFEIWKTMNRWNSLHNLRYFLTLSDQVKSLQGNKVPMRGTNGITWDGRLMFRYRIPLWQDGATYSIKYKGEEVLSIDVEGSLV